MPAKKPGKPPVGGMGRALGPSTGVPKQPKPIVKKPGPGVGYAKPMKPIAPIKKTPFPVKKKRP